MADSRIGLGWDIHRLREVPGGSLALGGCRLPCDLEAIAHSDGDVVLHALCDGLLGARGLGDIGEHFPDRDPRWRGIASHELLAAVLALPGLAGWSIVNVDINIIAERPRLTAHKPALRQKLSELLSLPLDGIGVKARSAEGLDAIGRGEAIAAQAVVLITRRD